MRGFTLIELVVSVAVIVIISAIALANYRFGGDINDLNNSAQELSVNIRRIQHLALSAAQFGSNVPQGGYGIYFDKNNYASSYILFADSDSDRNYDSPSELIDEGEINLKRGIKINDIKTGGVSLATTSITFLPPDPEIFINGATSTTSTEITLCIEKNCSQYTKKIIITNTGKVEIQ